MRNELADLKNVMSDAVKSLSQQITDPHIGSTNTSVHESWKTDFSNLMSTVSADLQSLNARIGIGGVWRLMAVASGFIDRQLVNKHHRKKALRRWISAASAFFWYVRTSVLASDDASCLFVESSSLINCWMVSDVIASKPRVLRRSEWDAAASCFSSCVQRVS